MPAKGRARHDEGFDQELCIRPIDNAFSVYDDPHYQLPDGSDREWCFVTEWVDRDKFEAKYGFEPTDIKDAGKGDDAMQLWFEDKRVQVAEYWRVRLETDKIEAEGQSRDVEKKIVESFLLTGDRIITDSEWAGTCLPIIPVFGETKNIEGKKFRKSLIRDAKESQRINNYFLSAEVESTALQPKAPYLGPVGSFETDQAKWAKANEENHAYLQFDVTPEAPGMRPERQAPPAFPSALREVRMASIEAMKAQMGIYDASLGARSNETSGVAIEARANQGDQSTYHYIDNMTRAIRYAGSVLIELIPKIYDTARVVRILQPDGQATMVAVNQMFGQAIDPSSMQPFPSYDIKTGRYDVVVKAGPSYSTQREANNAALAQLIKAYPPSAQVLGPLMVKNMDFPDSDEAAQKLEGAGKPQGLPPEIQQHMQDMQKALQQSQKQASDLEFKLQQEQLRGMAKDVALKDKGHANNTDESKLWVDVILKLLEMNQQGQQHADTMNQAAQVHQDGVQQNVAQHQLATRQHMDGVAQGQQQFTADQSNADRQFGHQVEVDNAAAEAARIKQDAEAIAT
jgi:hypothetical protein